VIENRSESIALTPGREMSMFGIVCGMSRKNAVTFAMVLLSVIAGCAPATTTIRGKVSFQSEPLTHGTLTLLAADGVGYSAAIGADGAFEIAGIPVGEAKVGILSKASSIRKKAPPPSRGPVSTTSKGNNVPVPIAPAPPISGPQVPDRLADPTQSGLTVIVKAGQALMIDAK